MLRKVRIFLALVFFVGITLLFLDVTGVLHLYLGWMAKVQLLPAILSLNFIVVAAVLLFTWVFGRVYCSVICPLGVLQDFFSWVASRFKKKRFHYAPPHNWFRYIALAVFVVLMVLGMNELVVLVAPYSMYGRIATILLQPLYVFANNLLALAAEHFDSYAFYGVAVVRRGVTALVVAIVSLLVVAFLTVRYGRLWCNTVCPVGSLLSLVSRYSILAPSIDNDKCVGCKICAKKCKAMCIDPETHTIDGSRCVVCMDCLKNCSQGAIRYTRRRRSAATSPAAVDVSRRKFFAASAVLAVLGGQKRVRAAVAPIDGGLAVIEDKQVPHRNVPLVPFGAQGADRFSSHCTSCQLCVSECPSHILAPSNDLASFLQPQINYVSGFCRPECTRCSQVCPTGAIRPITPETKSSISIGHAVFVPSNCLSARDGVSCGSCARHCPAGAIRMVDNGKGVKIPAVIEERCIGCGACEFYCPSRPFSAIYVEGRQVHTNV